MRRSTQPIGPRRPTLSAVCPPVLLLALLVLASCAKKGAPTGGPPDIEPPRFIGSVPDSGAAGVPRDARITLSFSEPMEPRGTGDAVALAPRIAIKERHWSRHAVTLVLAESLAANHSYTVFLGGGARDLHGNALAGRSTLVFTTAPTLPPGVLEGRIEARGFSAGGTYVWCYDAATGHEPDSTARDFDAVGITDAEGQFRVVGLMVPGRYRLWVFADLNNNRSFEPQSDILAPVDTVFTLGTDHPALSGFAVTVVNPRAPGRIRGAVLDSLGSREGTLAIVAVAADDSTRRVPGIVDDQGAFNLELAAGTWILRAWRDVDRSRTWQPATEPASAPQRFVVPPAGDIVEVKLVLVRPGGR
ncbi:MAG: Ig-like domain-containing protein [Candidatus Eisenbacteria bacterium]|uniref:Ig-like domain-containing protein n=1 Tax=Eiseniibacteriota bacterium TaxID=2212470 RepID=A0A9D6LA39_UNCEI|nr:Ig-like domain-containing protein [Candidatus Eisenbacteria bacterium]MBI3539687.1 Ig-like domain-containing protein [Candidatus Eisenbacteria bacterium]